jgi:flagellar motor switch protein FliN/FliY
MSDEFADAFAGAQEIPAPAAVLTDERDETTAEAAPSFDIGRAIPAPRTAPVMGREARDLPPLPTPDLPELGAGSAPGEARDLRLLADVQVELAVEIGRVKLPLRNLLSLAPGAVLELDRAADAPVDVLVNGCLVARGEVVVIDGEFGVRVTAVVER